MRVLVACEFSGIVRDAFAAKGHEAWSCDLLPSERKGNHIQGDIFDWIDQPKQDGCKCIRCGAYSMGDNCRKCGEQAISLEWDLLIFHWPCTLLCNSGVRWLYGGKGKVRDAHRFSLMYQSGFKFRMLLTCKVPKICGENPIPHGFAMQAMGRKWDQKIQPWQFGHPESKATCLWLKNLPPLQPTKDVKADFDKIHKSLGQRVWYESPGPDRWKNRSRTYQGIADAMAEQWG